MTENPIQCKTCKSAYLVKVGDNKYNCVCGLLERLINCTIEKDHIDKDINTPSWCPKFYQRDLQILNQKAEKEKEATKCLVLKTNKMLWESVSKKISWDDVEKDAIFHVPPYLENPRMDIKIVFKCFSYATYRKLDNNKSYETFILHPTDLLMKIMTKPKSKIAII